MNLRQNRIVGAMLVGAMALGGVANAQQSGEGSLPQTLIDQLTPLALYPGQQWGTPGGVTYVKIEGAGEWSYLDGRSGLDVGSAPVTLDSVFGIGSVTKTFTATAVLRMIADGANGLTLDDTLSSFATVPELPYDNEITIAQLLQHTSGINDFGLDPGFNCIVLPSNCPGSRMRRRLRLPRNSSSRSRSPWVRLDRQAKELQPGTTPTPTT